MKRGARVLHAVLAVLFAATVLSTTAQPEASYFTTVDLFVVSDAPVAAWQVELTERRGAMQIVGIERGDDSTFRDPPYYDRAALDADYRLSVLWLIAIPMWQAGINIPPVIWWNNLERIFMAVDDLGCRDLLG